MLSTRVGALTVHVLSDGVFHLDGGAVFGIVPKVLWAQHLPADEHNRVRLGLNCVLIEASDGSRVLLDAGAGDRWSALERERLGLVGGGQLLQQLESLGLTPDDIDVVVLSHLHFDHAGGAVRRSDDGTLGPTFPRARHVVQDVEWREANAPHERHRASYRADDFVPLEEAGLLAIVDGTLEVAPDVWVALTPGHCPGLQVAWVESEGETLVFPSDLLPTRAHVRPAWHLGFDLDPRATVDAKRALLEDALRDDWLLALDHDADAPLVRLTAEERDGKRVFGTVPEGVEATA